MPTRLYTFELNDNANNALSDITYITAEKHGSYRLSRPAMWMGKVPCDRPEVNSTYGDGYPFLSKNRRLKVRLDGTIVFNGIVMNVTRTADENQAHAVFTAFDPMIWWKSRPVFDVSGNLGSPDFLAPISGPEILKEAVDWSGYFTSVPEDYAESQMGLDTSTGDFDAYGDPNVLDLSVVLADFPKTLADLASLLTNTGAMDIVIEPIDTAEGYSPNIMGRLNAVTEAGQDRSDIHFDYGQGDDSIKALEHIDSMETLCNRLYMYFGPRLDPDHWKGLITGSDQMLTQPQFVQDRQALLVSMMAESRARFGYWMDVQIMDSNLDSYQATQARKLYEILWQTETYLRVNGRELVNFTPIAGAPYLPFTDYNLGDTVRLNINSDKFGVGFDNVSTRIYGFDVRPDLEGVEHMGQMVTSADAE